MNSYPVARVEPEVLKMKTEKVIFAFADIHKVLQLSPLPKSVADTVAFMNDRFASFRQEIKFDDRLDPAVDAAGMIATCGLNIANAFRNITSFATHADLEIGHLIEVSQDLKQYCDAHAIVVNKSIDISDEKSRSHPTVKSDENERLLRSVADAQASFESTKRQVASMEARLTGLGDSADKAMARMESVISNLSDTARQAIDEQKILLDATVTEAIKGAKDALSGIEEIRNNAQSAAGDVAVAALSKDYILHSESENSAADSFRKVTLLTMMGVGAFLLATLVQLTIGVIHWQDVAARLSLTLVLSVPIAYTARESAKHRALAIDLRRTGLDFRALAPYLETIPEPTKSQLKLEIAQRVFFTGPNSDALSSFTIDPQAIIMKGMDTVSDLVKQKKP